MTKTPAKVASPSSAPVPKESAVLAEKQQKIGPKKRKVKSPQKRTDSQTRDGQHSQQKAKHRLKPGTVALREIRRLQKTTDLLLRKLPFVRLVREVLEDMYSSNSIRWQPMALLGLQEATEAYLIALFKESNIVAINSKRVTVMVRDIRVVRRILGAADPGNR